MKKLDFMSCYVLFQKHLPRSSSKLCPMTSQRTIGGVISSNPGQLLGMFGFPEKFTKVKAWCNDVVSRAVRRNTY